MLGYPARMDAPLRLLIHGASGRMGQALLRLCAEDPRYGNVVAAVSRKPAQRVVDGVPQFAASELHGVPAFDVAIDFSRAEAFDPILALCVERKVALVSGTTGLDDAQRAALDAAADLIPLAWASNFSLGVAVLADLVERAARAAGLGLRHRRSPPRRQGRRALGHRPGAGCSGRAGRGAAALCLAARRRHRR